MNINKELTSAAASLLILKILKLEESYGYNILKAVMELSDHQWEWTEGMLYPILHRLEKQNHIQANWKTAPTGRKRKYYKTTSTGSAYIQELEKQWHFINELLGKAEIPLNKEESDEMEETK